MRLLVVGKPSRDRGVAGEKKLPAGRARDPQRDATRHRLTSETKCAINQSSILLTTRLDRLWRRVFLSFIHSTVSITRVDSLVVILVYMASICDHHLIPSHPGDVLSASLRMIMPAFDCPFYTNTRTEGHLRLFSSSSYTKLGLKYFHEP